ncbi:MAG: T9SS type A sorting domain-containing protein [Taibaiella sp.]|nr:T9SS type A sorting domain-containing protein [Taibaiella sp.]
MKQIVTLKNLLLASCIAGTGIANAQIHPLAFGARTLMGGATAESNWYADYVGLRFVVNSPASVAGQKIYTHPGIGTTPWGTTVTTPIVNTQIVIPSDTLAAAALPAGSLAGKIGYVYRGGGVEFVCKAERCAAAGAVACVIVNNIPGGPIGMGPGTTCPVAGVTIPVFMISKEEGDAITALYRANDTARFTITPWGLGNAKDLGFVPSGVANWHNFAIPSNQLGASGNPHAYKMIDGSFIANYGSDDVTGVKVSSTLSFTPIETGVPAVQHTDTVNLATFKGFAQPVLADRDSIYAMYANSEYDLSAPGKGRFDLTYRITHSVADDYPADNTLTTSFYTTDSLYAKARYDFTTNAPIRTIYNSWNSGGDFLWGPMYFVKNAGTALSRVQYSLSTNAGGVLGTTVNIYLFKWVDGANTQPNDSLMQDGELDMVGIGTHSYDGVSDTSGANLNFRGMTLPSGTPANIMLEANTWYYLAIGVPGGHFLGSDGIMHPLTRIYGRGLGATGILDYSNLVQTTSDFPTTTPAQANAPVPGTFANFVTTIDSFNFASTRGLIPSVAMIVNNNPSDISVKSSPEVLDTRVNLFPNPAKESLKVSLSLDQTSKSVTYTIIDGLGRFVSKETHNNVKEENFTINTSKLASGHYFFVVNTDSRTISKSFIIAK